MTITKEEKIALIKEQIKNLEIRIRRLNDSIAWANSNSMEDRLNEQVNELAQRKDELEKKLETL